MITSICAHCWRRSLSLPAPPTPLSAPSRRTFSTTTPFLAAGRALATKKNVVARPEGGKGKRLHLKKNARVSTGRPPAPGERKAVRKRIVLSNTNALEVKGLRDLTGDRLIKVESSVGNNVPRARTQGAAKDDVGASETQWSQSLAGKELNAIQDSDGMRSETSNHALAETGGVALERSHGAVLGFTDETVDALRALEAFRSTQAWHFFRRPATLIRKETVDVAKNMTTPSMNGQYPRKVIFGTKGGGKSVLLLQAQAMAFLKGWVVVHFPEGQDLVNGHTAYRPVRGANGLIYIQPEYTAKLLTNVAAANNRLLSTLRLSKEHNLPIPVQPNMSLSRFAELGARDPELAWPVWQALWSELTAKTGSQAGDDFERPPIFVSMDGMDQTMRMSAYLDAEANAIHAHDLALVRQFADLLAGQTSLPNGGMVMAATCESNRSVSQTLDFVLRNNVLKQQGEQDLLEWNPYDPQDSRVVDTVSGVSTVKLGGLSHAEARGVMEYYAQSGMLRSVVTDGLVGEKWTLAGSGLIGELEKGSVRARF